MSDGIAVRLGASAERFETRCGDGTMVWRAWGEGEPVILLHGGSGSWRHWVRNVDALAAHRRVVAADLPGLGDSSLPPERFDAGDLAGSVDRLAAIVDAGIRAVLGDDARFDLVGFSLGSIVGSYVAARAGARVRAFVTVGATGLGLSWGGLAGTVRPLAPDVGIAGRRATHRHNLSLIMLADPASIDDLAVDIQIENVARARIRTYPLADSDVVRGSLPRVRASVHGIWGDRDVYALPDLEARGRAFAALSPGATFHVLPGAGHWAMYERAREFDALLARLL